MKTCAKEYHEKNIPKSDYRKFMSECRKRKAEEAKRDPSALAEKTGNSIVKKSRTAACRRAAIKQGLHLDLRKIFVGECATE